MNFKLKIVFISIILHSSFLILNSQAHAESISLALDPPIIQINAIPPANIVSPLSIENRGDSQLNLKVEIEPFIPSEQENGQVKYVVGRVDGVSVKDEAGQELTEFKLDSRQKKKLTLAVNVTKDFPQKDYYFSVIFLSTPGSSSTSSSQSVSGIASNVLLSVGQGKVSGEIEEFSAPVFAEKGPVPFSVRIKNTSNHFITPKGEILIKNLFGQTIGRVDLGQVNILSQSTRIIPSSDFLNGDNNLPSNLAAYWPEKFILGPYKASLSITLSDTGPLFRRSIIFFAFPAKETGIAVVLIIFILYIMLKVKSKI